LNVFAVSNMGSDDHVRVIRDSTRSFVSHDRQ
jgi:hypothetical protein